jgi:IMP dehydrogenase/GMP reductase
MEKKFDFNDILIVPSSVTKIESRKEINPYYNGFLPLITAPMDTVISCKNEKIFFDLKINTCLPRGESSAYGFTSFSLNEIKMKYINNELKEKNSYLIDIANGHMEELVNIVKDIKHKFPDIKLMVGNVANPITYRDLSNAGADYVRVGIGNGGGCLTTQQLGVGYPMGSLIKECYEQSLTLSNSAKIVADGGMKTYSDIIKALALGADYVMIGSIFNKSIESCGDNYIWGWLKVNQKIAQYAYEKNVDVYKKFRGMSTKEVQKKWKKEKLTTSEGVVRFRKVEYTLNKWVDNFDSYLRSAMSYTNSKNLSDFIGNVKIINITNSSYDRFNK